MFLLQSRQLRIALTQRMQHLDNGLITRVQMAYAFLASNEALQDAIASAFQTFFLRQPSAAETQALLSVLQTTGPTPEEFVAVYFLGTDNYFNEVQVVSIAQLPFA